MVKNTIHARGFIIALIVGVGFVTMAVVYLDTESSDLMKQLIGVFVLIAGLIGFAALIAWLMRLAAQKISKK